MNLKNVIIFWKRPYFMSVFSAFALISYNLVSGFAEMFQVMALFDAPISLGSCPDFDPRMIFNILVTLLLLIALIHYGRIYRKEFGWKWLLLSSTITSILGVVVGLPVLTFISGFMEPSIVANSQRLCECKSEITKFDRDIGCDVVERLREAEKEKKLLK